MRGVRKRASTHGWVRAGRRGRLNRRPIDPARRRAERGGRSFVRRRRRRRHRRPVAETRRGPNVEHPIGPTRSDPIQPPQDERARSTTTDGVRAIPSARARRRRETPRLGRGSVLERARRRREEKNKRKPKTRVRRASASSIDHVPGRDGGAHGEGHLQSSIARAWICRPRRRRTSRGSSERPSARPRPFPNRGVMNGEIVI